MRNQKYEKHLKSLVTLPHRLPQWICAGVAESRHHHRRHWPIAAEYCPSCGGAGGAAGGSPKGRDDGVGARGGRRDAGAGEHGGRCVS